jgi:DNA invertase Pin-like site-specific DNA recombinase
MSKAVAYYRVSTDKQGRSGLGMAAQRAAVESLCAARGWELVAPPFTEIESGKKADRPEMLKAIDRCRQTGAVLVIAKTDRLTRDLETLVMLEKSGVEFIAADNPDANRLTIRLLVVIAQNEREAISRRTKEALAAAKARGQRLGNPNGAAAFAGKNGSAVGVRAVIRKADDHAEMLRPVIDQLRAAGHTSLGSIANQLNDQGMLTPRRGRWYASSVRNLLARLDASKAA